MNYGLKQSQITAGQWNPETILKTGQNRKAIQVGLINLCLIR